MNPELKNPWKAAGTALAIIGGIMMLSMILYNVKTWITLLGFILWLAGIVILIVKG